MATPLNDMLRKCLAVSSNHASFHGSRRLILYTLAIESRGAHLILLLTLQFVIAMAGLRLKHVLILALLLFALAYLPDAVEAKTKKTKTTPTPTTATPTTTPTPTTATPKSTTATPTTTTATPAGTVAAAGSSSGTSFCATPGVNVSTIDVGVTVTTSEDEAGLKVLAIAAKPSGGSYIAFHSDVGEVVVMELDSSDKLVSGSKITVSVNDFADIFADDKGFVLLGTRDAEGGGTLNCGSPSNLCGTAPDPAIPCYDMYLIRYDGTTESWATKLTSSSATLPPYSTSKTGPEVYMIWWYAHHGRIAFDGTNWASYFGCALSVSQDSCINIHQGDRMVIVSPTGAVVTSTQSFDWGCSHSGYERITYDGSEYAMICKTDDNDRIKPPTSDATIYSVDLDASNLGDIVVSNGTSGGYWMTVSNSNTTDAKVHLMHFKKNTGTDTDIILGGAKANERAPHLATIGKGGMLAVWEGGSTGGDFEEGGDRTMYIQVRSSSTGAAISDVTTVSGVVGNRYMAFKSFPDGSVAYLSSSSTSSTEVKLLRVKAC